MLQSYTHYSSHYRELSHYITYLHTIHTISWDQLDIITEDKTCRHRLSKLPLQAQHSPHTIRIAK